MAKKIYAEKLKEREAASASLEEAAQTLVIQVEGFDVEATEESLKTLREIQRNLVLVAKNASEAACFLFGQIRAVESQLKLERHTPGTRDVAVNDSELAALKAKSAAFDAHQKMHEDGGDTHDALHMAEAHDLERLRRGLKKLPSR